MQQLAVGGMGTISRAFDHLAQREVAFKQLLIPAGGDRAQLTLLFEREFGALKRLPHPNIVEVYDYGLDAAGPYYTMELLPGHDLTTQAPMPYATACRVLRDVASALALVHARRLLHRDVSPRNIRVLQDGRAKLIDFGGLMPFGKPREVVGTPAFMAPECMSGVELEQTADLYSLGAVAYFLLTGCPMRMVVSMSELAAAHIEPPAPPSELAPEIPREFDMLVLSLLAEDPKSRPSSAAYVIDKLSSIANLAPESEERRIAYSYLAQPPLVGREGMVQALELAVHGAQSGRGRALMIEGAPGLGRTALLDKAELIAQLSDVTVLRADGHAQSGPFSLARTLADLAVGLSPRSFEDAPRFDSLFPTSGTPQSVRTAAEMATRRARALKFSEQALFRLSAEHPVLLLIDDVHAADAESLALVATLTEQVGAHHLSLVASSTSASMTTIADVHAHAKLRASAIRHTLQPLTESDFVQLLDGTFGNVPHSQRLAFWLHAQSGGNPGHCFELLKLLLQRGEIRYTVGTFSLPHDAQEGGAYEVAGPLSAQLEGASERARWIASALALHDGPLTVQQLAVVGEEADHQALRAVYELASRSLVRQVGNGFVLENRLLRSAFARMLDAASIRTLHARIGRALIVDDDSSIERRLSATQHLLEAGEYAAAERLLEPVSRDVLSLSNHGASAIRVLEAMLARDREAGRSDRACLRWLVPIVRLAFVSDIGAQRRHLELTASELAKLCGMALALRLKPWLGATVSLALGFLYAGCRRLVRPREREFGSLRDTFRNLVTIVMSACAVGTSSFDVESSQRVTAWLEPLAALPSRSGAFLMRECCHAMIELGTGAYDLAAARYARILQILRTQKRPLQGFDIASQRALFLGCLSGQAQAEVVNCSPIALDLADELEREDSVLFAPYPACTRMSYHALRGEVERAEVHRLQAEQLALRGGTWAFVTVLATRWAYAACRTHDVIRLVQGVAELQRLSVLAPNMRAIADVCAAWLEHLRGRTDQALVMFEEVIHSKIADQLPTRGLNHVMFATVLNAAHQHQRARAICTQLDVRNELVRSLRDSQLALAEAGLGNTALAGSILDAVLTRALPNDNPLELGNAHRDRAAVALLALDPHAFNQHLHAMSEWFRESGNPSLIHQCDALLAEAVRVGLRAPLQRGPRSSAPAELAGEANCATVQEGFSNSSERTV